MFEDIRALREIEEPTEEKSAETVPDEDAHVRAARELGERAAHIFTRLGQFGQSDARVYESLGIDYRDEMRRWEEEHRTSERLRAALERLQGR